MGACINCYSDFNLKTKSSYKNSENKNILLEIKNLNLRLTLIRYMQLMGVLCLFLSVLAMLVLFVGMHVLGIWLFALSIICLLISLGPLQHLFEMCFYQLGEIYVVN